MYMPVWIAVLALLGATSVAHAQHHNHGADDGDESSGFGAGVAVVAAAFDTMSYGGNYEGVSPSLLWSKGRFGAAVSTAVYRLEKNGGLFYGLGDLHAHGQARLVEGGGAYAGVIAGVSAPIGDRQHGLGMGHMMVMPAAFGVWSIDRVSFSGTAGYSRAIGGDSDHDHGPWPIVEPMLVSEFSWSAGADVAVAKPVRVGARASGGVPIGRGDDRVVGAVRVMWHAGRVDTAAEIQAGLAGDPFTVRGVVSTALSF